MGLKLNRRSLSLMVLAAPLIAECCKNSVAVIASLSGQATVQSPGSRQPKAVEGLDWISEGETLEVAPRSQVILILADGHRYKLEAGARLSFAANATPKITGAARELPALPPIPRFASVVAESAPTSGGVRVRGTEMKGLFPSAGVVVLPGKVTLRYRAVPDATSYQVSLEDETGAILLSVTTESTEVQVSGETIQAGTRYNWRVRAMRSGAAIAEGNEKFITLSAEETLRRVQFASALRANSDDLAALVVLADVDIHLGLVSEACDEFSAAFQQKPADVPLRRRLDSACGNIGRAAK